MAIKERIRSLRKNHLRLTLKDLADEFDVTAGFLSDIERGKNNPSYNFLRKLSDKFNVSIDWLFTGEGEMFLKTPKSTTGTRNGYEVLEGNVETYPHITLVEQISRTGWFRNLSPHKREIVAAVDEIQDSDYIRLTSENMLNKVQADRARAAEKARLRQKGETG